MNTRPLAITGAVLATLTLASAAHAQFASRLVAYDPAPGQFVTLPGAEGYPFNDPTEALGPPTGGGLASPNNSSVVTLGAFGGSITLAFDAPVENDPANPLGLDFIVFGNASFVGADPTRRFAEAATVEISRDTNHNALADDPWYLIPGSHLTTPVVRTDTDWDDDDADPTHPPSDPTWIPAGRSGAWTTIAYALPLSPFGAPVLVNPDGPGASLEHIWGYADCSPTALLGDTDHDGIADAPPTSPLADPGVFYTTPDDPFTVGIDDGSGGGDAFDIDWAVDPATGEPAGLASFDFIRITTAVPFATPGILGEVSAEIDAVADVRPQTPASPADWNADGSVNDQDFFDFVNDFFAHAGPRGTADFNADTFENDQDFFDFVNAFFGGAP